MYCVAAALSALGGEFEKVCKVKTPEQVEKILEAYVTRWARYCTGPVRWLQHSWCLLLAGPPLTDKEPRADRGWLLSDRCSSYSVIFDAQGSLLRQGPLRTEGHPRQSRSLSQNVQGRAQHPRCTTRLARVLEKSPGVSCHGYEQDADCVWAACRHCPLHCG